MIRRGKFVILFLLICGLNYNLSNVTAQLDTPWDISRDAYEYNYVYTVTTFDIDGASGGAGTHVTEKTIKMWGINANCNEITFRTDNLLTFLGMVECEREECYNQYREAFNYSEVDEGVDVTYVYDETSKKLGFLNPIYGTFLGFTEDIPVDPFTLPSMLLGNWDGIGFVFLPVLDNEFSFINDFTNYEMSYDDFNIHVDEKFTFEGKKFKGYSFEIESAYVDDISERKWTDHMKYSYNIKGVLYSFQSEGEYYRTVEDKLTKSSEYNSSYTIEDIDEELIVGTHWSSSFIGLFILAIYVLRRRNNIRV